MAPLKVIGAGYGRTGTLSLCRALDILGFSCHHMEKMLVDPSQNPTAFADAYEKRKNKDATGCKEPTDWGSIFQNYDAAVDWPAAAFWEDLLAEYPDAKVILTVRDAEEWYKSVQKTIYNWPMNVGAVWPEQMQRGRAMARTIVKEGELRNFDNKDAMIRQFEEHILRVKEVVPPSQLLVYNATQGWEPLCHFLEVKPPKDVSYPHLNKGDLFRDRLLQVKQQIEQQAELKYVPFLVKDVYNLQWIMALIGTVPVTVTARMLLVNWLVSQCKTSRHGRRQVLFLLRVHGYDAYIHVFRRSQTWITLQGDVKGLSLAPTLGNS